MADGGDEYDNKGGPRRWDKPAPLLPSLLALGAPSSSTAAARGKLSMSSSLSSGASSRQSSPARSTAPAAEPGPAGTQAHHPKKRKLDLGDDGAARPLSSIPRPQPLQSKPLETAQSRIPSAAGRPVRQSIARPTIVPSAAAGLLATSRPESRSRIFPQPTPDNNPFLTGPTSGTTASARTTPTSATRVFAPGERLLKVELAERDEKIRALQDELAKLKKKADRSSPQKASVETAPPQQAADVAALKAELDAARIELKRLEVERQIQDDNIEDLNEKLDGLTGLQSVGLVSANDSTPEVERLQTMVIDLEREVAKAKADKSEMARALDEAKEKALHAAAERDAVSGKCKLELLRAEGFVREQRVKIEALEKAAEDSAESVLVAQQRVTELSEELKSVENRLASKEQESKSLSDEVAKLKEDLEQQSMKLATLEDPANRVPPAAFLRLPIPLDTMPDLSTMKWALTKICAQYYRIQTQHEEHLFEMAEALASEMAAVVDEKEPAEDLLLSPVLDVEDLPEVVEIAAPLSSEKCELSGQLDAPESQAKDDQIQVDSLKTMVAQLQDEIQSMKSLQAHAEQGTLRAKRLASDICVQTDEHIGTVAIRNSVDDCEIGGLTPDHQIALIRLEAVEAQASEIIRLKEEIRQLKGELAIACQNLQASVLTCHGLTAQRAAEKSQFDSQIDHLSKEIEDGRFEIARLFAGAHTSESSLRSSTAEHEATLAAIANEVSAVRSAALAATGGVDSPAKSGAVVGVASILNQLSDVRSSVDKLQMQVDWLTRCRLEAEQRNTAMKLSLESLVPDSIPADPAERPDDRDVMSVLQERLSNVEELRDNLNCEREISANAKRLNAEHDARIQELEAQISATAAQLVELQLKCGSQSEETETLQQQLKAAQAENARLAESVEHCQRDLQTWSDKAKAWNIQDAENSAKLEAALQRERSTIEGFECACAENTAHLARIHALEDQFSRAAEQISEKEGLKPGHSEEDLSAMRLLVAAQDENARLAASIDEIRAQLQLFREKAETWTAKEVAAEQELQAARKRAEDISEEVQRLSTKILANEDKIRVLEDELTTSRNKIQELQSRHDAKSEEASSIQIQLNAASAENVRLATEIEKFRGDITSWESKESEWGLKEGNLTARLTSVLSEHESSFTALAAKDAEVVLLREKIQQLEGHVEEAEAGMRTSSTLNEGLQSLCDSLQATNAEITENLATTQLDLKKTLLETDELVKSLKSAAARNSELSQEIKELQESLSQVRQTVADQEALISANALRLEEAERANAAARNDLVNAQESLGQARQTVGDQDATISANAKRLEEIERAHATAHSDLAIAHDRINQFEKDCKEWDEARLTLESQRLNLEQELGSITSELADARAQHAKDMLAAADRLKACVEGSEIQIRELKSEVEELLKSVEAGRGELEDVLQAAKSREDAMLSDIENLELDLKQSRGQLEAAQLDSKRHEENWREKVVSLESQIKELRAEIELKVNTLLQSDEMAKHLTAQLSQAEQQQSIEAASAQSRQEQIISLESALSECKSKCADLRAGSDCLRREIESCFASILRIDSNSDEALDPEYADLPSSELLNRILSWYQLKHEASEADKALLNETETQLRNATDEVSALTKSCSTLRSENDEKVSYLETRIKDLERLKDSFEDEVELLRRQLQNSESDRSVAEKVAEQVTLQLGEFESQVCEMRASIDEYERSTAELVQSLQDKEASSRALDEELSSLKSAFGLTQDRVNEMINDLLTDDLKAVVNAADQSNVSKLMEAKIDALRAAYERLEEEKLDLLESVDAGRRATESSNEALAKAEASAQELARELSTCRAFGVELEKKRAEIRQFESALILAQSEMEARDAELARTKAVAQEQEAEHQRQLSTMRPKVVEVDASTETIENIDEEMDKITAALTDVLSREEVLRAELDDARDKLRKSSDELEMTRTALDNDALAFRSVISENVTKVKNLVKERDSLSEQVEELSNKVGDLSSRLKVVDDYVAKRELEIAAKDLQIQELSSEVAGLQGAKEFQRVNEHLLPSLKKEVEDAKKRAEDAEAESNRLEAEFHDAKGKLANTIQLLEEKTAKYEERNRELMERLEDGEEAEKTLLAKLEDLINDRKSLSEKVESLESEINESRAQQALLEEQMQACKEASAELEQRANDTASYNEVLLEQSLARVKEMKALSATRQKLERQVQKLQSELAAKDPLSVLPSDRILHSPNATNSKLITRAVSSSPEGSASAASSSKRSAASSDAPLPPPKFVKNEALSAVFKMPATPAATAVPTEAAGPLRPSPGKAKGESAAAAESGPSQSSPPPRQAEQEPKRNARRRTIAASSALRSDQQQQQQPQSRTHPSKPECSQQ